MNKETQKKISRTSYFKAISLVEARKKYESALNDYKNNLIDECNNYVGIIRDVCENILKVPMIVIEVDELGNIKYEECTFKFLNYLIDNDLITYEQIVQINNSIFSMEYQTKIYLDNFNIDLDFLGNKVLDKNSKCYYVISGNKFYLEKVNNLQECFKNL